MKRILWVLDYGADQLDAKDTAEFREKVQKFLTEERSATTLGDGELLTVMHNAETRKRAELAASFSAPRLIEQHTADTFSPRFRLAGPEGETLLGTCKQLSRYDPKSGMPLTPIYINAQVGGSSLFEYNSEKQALICGATWVTGQVGLIVADAQTGLKMDFVSIPDTEVYSLQFACDQACSTVFAATVMLGNKPGALWRIDLRDGSAKQIFKLTEKDYSPKVAVSPDGGTVFISTKENYRVMDGMTGKPLFSGKAEAAAFSASSRTLATKLNTIVEIRSLPKGERIAVRDFDYPGPDFADNIRGLQVNDQELVFIGVDGEQINLSTWNYQANEVSRGVKLEGPFDEFGFDSIGHVYNIGRGGAWQVDRATGKANVAVHASGRWSAKAAAFSPDSHLAAVVRPSELAVTDLTTGQLVSTISTMIGDPKAATFLDNQRIVIGDKEGKLEIFDVKTGGHIGSLPSVSGEVLTLVAAHDRPYLAVRSSTSYTAHTISVFDTNQRRKVSNTSAKSAVGSLSSNGGRLGFADNERRVVFGDDHFVVAFDIASGKAVMRRELRTNIKKEKNRTTWFWSGVTTVISRPNAGGAVLFSARSLVGASVLYEYRDGDIRLVEGSINGGETPDYLAARIPIAAALSDGQILGAFSDQPVVANLVNDTYSQKYEKLKGEALALTGLANGRFAIADATGEVRIYDISKEEPTISVLLYDQANWLTVANRGYFAGTRSAAENLFLATSPTDTIAIDSLFDTLYRPDLVAATSAGITPAVADRPETKLDVTALLKDGLPPKVSIMSPIAGAHAAEEFVTARAAIEPGSGGVGRIEWRVNGITRVSRRPDVQQQKATIPFTIDDKLLLESGANEIELTVYNATDKLASTPARITASLGESGKTSPPRLFVLSIGVNDYWDSRLRLNYASTDASDIAKAFDLAGGGLFEEVKTWLLTDGKVTRAQIAATFDDIAKTIRSSDVFILFVAGHGKTEDGRYYFLPYDLNYTGPGSIAEQGIGQNDWQNWMTRVATRKSLLLFDTCESGTLTLERTTRGFDKLAALDRLTRATGRSVLAAASDDGPALEGFQGHGVFAYTILEGLGAADEGHTGLVQVTSLASYVGRRVPEISFGKFGIRQLPQMKLTGEDFSVGRSVQAVSKLDEDFLPVQATHVLLTATSILDAQGNALGENKIAAGTLVRVISKVGEISEIARNGKKLGYVASPYLAPLQ